ncbi:transglycosylase SLT domain-containing protein [Streptomyces sp. NPDC005438]|uniref:aggregation-promoting factor C-terminal-like domain-containing protein n=1 Tax=Streptomyces sp. NPDC005438 TaxID=3156880 RepID=UPI00339F708D
MASATAVTTVGAVVGVAAGNQQDSAGDVEATAADSNLLADVPAGEQAHIQNASLTQQADDLAAKGADAAKKSAEEAARKQAAEDAAAKKAEKIAAKKEAAAKKAAKEASEREKEKSSASRGNDRADFGDVKGSYTVGQVQSMAREIVGSGQFQCFSNIVNNESSWNYRASNPSSGAYGLVQALPGSKMASAGADWQTNPATQIKWGLNYMNDRYGSPCGAWSFWQANHWY